MQGEKQGTSEQRRDFFIRKFHVSVVPALQRMNAEWSPKRYIFYILFIDIIIYVLRCAPNDRERLVLSCAKMFSGAKFAPPIPRPNIMEEAIEPDSPTGDPGSS